MYTLAVIVSLLLWSSLSAARAQIPIVVETPGSVTVEQAAAGERDVDWMAGEGAGPTACTLSFAATELRTYLSRIAGAAPERFPLLRWSEYRGGPAIVLATTAQKERVRALPPAVGRAASRLGGPGAFAIVPTGGGVVILGSGRAGVLYGAYRLLEEMGVRWYAPGPGGEVLQTGRSFRLPEREIVETPRYATRGYFAWEDRGHKDFYLWMARNRLNLWTVAEPDQPLLKKLGIQSSGGSHWILLRWLNPHAIYPYNHPRFDGDEGRPADPYPCDDAEYRGDANGDGKLTYFEAHPEWYGLRGGKRQTYEDFIGTNFCTSNPNPVAELMKNMIADLAGGEFRNLEMLDFWTLDNGRWCECERCKPLGAPTDRLLRLVQQARDAIDQARGSGRLRRDVALLFPIYHETLTPPSLPLPKGFDTRRNIGTYFPIRRCYIHALDDPRCTEDNEPYVKTLKAWLGGPLNYRGELFMGEYYNVSLMKSLPVLHTRTMPRDIRTYYDWGFRHFHYMHVSTRLLGPRRFNEYLMARLLWDTAADGAALLGEYIRDFYGPAAQPMAKFYDRLEFAMSPVKQWKHIPNSFTRRVNSDAAELFATTHVRLETRGPGPDDGIDLAESLEALAECRRLMDACLKMNLPPAVRLRIEEDDRNLRYGENTVKLYDSVARSILARRAGDRESAARHFRAGIPCARALMEETGIVKASASHANAKNGLDASLIEGAWRKLAKELAVPLDF